MTADERRAMVLEAALAEFAARGYEGTSTEDIARRAGISQPYLFRLFPTKKSLFLALLPRGFQRVREAFAAATGDLTGMDALAAMADCYHRLLEDPTLLLIQLQAYAAANEDDDIRAVTRAAFSDLWRLVERLTGLPFEQVKEFFAMGMLINVAAALDLPAIDERWAKLFQL